MDLYFAWSIYLGACWAYGWGVFAAGDYRLTALAAPIVGLLGAAFGWLTAQLDRISPFLGFGMFDWRPPRRGRSRQSSPGDLADGH
jgi:hypothetical protein